MNTERRGPWYLVTGLILGVVLGLAYAWGVQPVQYVDTSPASLRSDFQDQYRALIALAYQSNGDLVRAKARLELLKDPDLFRALSEQAQRTLAEGRSLDEARALGMLALALGQEAPGPAVVITLPPTPTLTNTSTHTPSPSPQPSQTPIPTPTATSTPLPPTSAPSATEAAASAQPATFTAAAVTSTPPTPTETPIPRPTSTLTPTRTPTLTPGGPFALTSRERVCASKLASPQIQVQAKDSQGQPLAGVLVIVTWQGGEERFYTGLKVEKGPGYADFTMQPGITYSLRLGENGELVSDLSTVQCSGGSWGAWLLTFVQL